MFLVFADQPKRGAPVGHRGGSRKRPEEISEYLEIYPKVCDKCGSAVKIYENKFDEHVVEDIEIKKKIGGYSYVILVCLIGR